MTEVSRTKILRTFLEATGIESDLICAEITPLVN